VLAPYHAAARRAIGRTRAAPRLLRIVPLGMLAAMSSPHHLELAAGFARYRPVGRTTLVETVELIASVIAHCRENGIDRLLIDVTGLDGVAIPSMVDRFLMVEEWAREAAGKVAVAMVVRPEYMHPTKFGVQVAVDLGMTFDTHHTEAHAVQWLAQLSREAP
jgi:hypothetical protein